MIVSSSDFVGLVSVSSSNEYGNRRFEQFLDVNKENAFIYDILGKDLGQAFIDDLSGDPSTPTSQKWIDIFSPFVYEYNGCPVNCVGIKQILVNYFYSEFVNVQSITNNVNGNSSTRGEATDFAGGIQLTTVIDNRNVSEINALQYFVAKDGTTYPDFRGIQFEFNPAF